MHHACYKGLHNACRTLPVVQAGDLHWLCRAYASAPLEEQGTAQGQVRTPARRLYSINISTWVPCPVCDSERWLDRIKD